MLYQKIFDIRSKEEFKSTCLEVFQYQYEHTEVYRKFCDLLKTDPSSIKKIGDIPFLPITFFKEFDILSSEKKSTQLFTSSGTTGSSVSKHFIADLKLYEESFLKGFQYFYGDIKKWTVLALLPSYLEKEGSSLVYMVDRLIKDSQSTNSGFYLHNLNELINKILELERKNEKTLLIGVSYALLDLLEKQKFELNHTTIVETGGMKGKRKEMVKEELHFILKNGFGVPYIHSEYGMTELLSQAYSNGNGIFSCPPWMKILTRDTEDALSLVIGKTGGINVIDLANIYSCSFIATQDLGKAHSNDTFEILGRFDTSDIRGCNLMVL